MAIDLASGNRVRLQLAPAGTRSEQQTWVDACARAYAEGRLVDFGFIGTAHRFEAFARQRARDGRHMPASESLLEWLERSHPSSMRVLCRTATASRARSSLARIRALRCRASRTRHAFERHPGRARETIGRVAGFAQRAVERRTRGAASSPVERSRCLRHRAARAPETPADCRRSREQSDLRRACLARSEEQDSAYAGCSCRAVDDRGRADAAARASFRSRACASRRSGSGRAQRRLDSSRRCRTGARAPSAHTGPRGRCKGRFRRSPQLFSAGTGGWSGNRRYGSPRSRADGPGGPGRSRADVSCSVCSRGRASASGIDVVCRNRAREDAAVAATADRRPVYSRSGTPRPAMQSAARDTGVSSPGSTSPAVHFPRHARQSHMRVASRATGHLSSSRLSGYMRRAFRRVWATSMPFAFTWLQDWPRHVRRICRCRRSS